ncbi:serine/threonine-protein kinase [Nocardia stercoris]|uniref:mitogen-activated protein kinase kinase n=1 Tax=Nocardia stercoris TaxID=2483361 RepID=A0A3M2L9P7_9NOCA|nr:serine/threonine-protein kinase [Nocardia stercoris]RMI34312.1 protein kinase [Nocardia stercoris]
MDAHAGENRSNALPAESNTQPSEPADMASELAAVGLFDAQEIGRGGFGVVYRCAQRALDRIVAVKVLTSAIDEENRGRFLREEQAMGRLSGHPNIVDVLQVDVTKAGQPYIVMPYAVHGSLERLVAEHGPLSWQNAVRVGVKMAGAIESAHRVHVLHRDVKPANVLLTRYGEPQLTDFGIARIPGGFRTSANLITGSPAFTAPEVLSGSAPTVQSDIYSLGSTLFALITGHAAYERRAGERVVAQFLRMTTQPIPDLREQHIPPDLAAIIERAMSTEPEQRPASALEMGELLRGVQIAHDLVPDEMALLDADEDEAGPIPAGFEAQHTGATPSSGARRAGPLLPPESEPTTARPSSRDDTAIWTGGPAGVLPPTSLTKFAPKTPTREPVRRPRLLDILRAGGDRRLAVIHGPAGYGKSTLAAQWRAELTDAGVAVPWIGIDRGDNNEVWFLAHLVQAIQRVRPEIGVGLEQALEERSDEAVPYAIATLIDDIHTAGKPLVVVIDDWDRVTDAGAHRVLDSLLDNGGHFLRFVVTTQAQGGLPLNRLRVRDELVEVNAADLPLTTAETGQILVERNHFPLTEPQVAQIRQATDGWPAAVQLVSLSLQPSGDTGADADETAAAPAVETLLAHLTAGDNEAIREYLAENVLDAMEPRMLEFLMAIAVPEKVSASLAAAVSGDPDAGELLERAQQRELFVRRLDHDPGWFRMQPLFAEYLRGRLERMHPGRTKALHRKASRWYAEHQLFRKAVDHALAATDLKLAADLLESGGMDLLDASRVATLLGSVSKLPVQQVASRTKLLMALARANISLQQSGAARGTLGRLSSLLARSTNGAETESDRCQAAVLAAVDQVSRDHTEGVVDRLSPCLSPAEKLPAWTVSTAANLLAFVRLCEFDYDGVREIEDWAEPYHARASDPQGRVYGLLARGTAAYEQLDIASATAYYRKAYDIARSEAGARSQAVRVAAAQLGDVAYRRGDLAAAGALLDESHQLVARVGPVDFLITVFVVGARVQMARGDTEGAQARLAEGARLAADHRLLRLDATIRAEQLRLGFPVSERVPAPIDSPGGSARHVGTAMLIAEAEEIAAIRALMAGRPVAGGITAGENPAPLGTDDTVVKRARALYGRIAEHHRPRAELDAALLLTECLATAGWAGEALATLIPVVARCAELGWTRPLLDAGPGVIGLLRTLRDDMALGGGYAEQAEIPRQFLDLLI